MNAPLTRYNDGSPNPPRLRVQHSLWSLLGLPMNAPPDGAWTLGEKFGHVKEAGFEAVECWLDESDERRHKDALDAAGLRLVLGHHPLTLEDTRRTIEQAKRLNADFVFAQPLHPYVPLDEAVSFLREAVKIAAGHGLPLFIETHRGNIPESLNQALELIERMPEITFTGDLSHFVVIGEFYGWEDERAIDRMDPILARRPPARAHLQWRAGAGGRGRRVRRDGPVLRPPVGECDVPLAPGGKAGRRVPLRL